MKDIKKIDIKEFREKGYLQELNRRFLHPLGLALGIKVDEEGNEYLDGIWDHRNDEEGIYFDLSNSDEVRKNKFQKNKEFIDKEMLNKVIDRTRILGFSIEPIYK